jgi:hybrid cluster-associated redox disulfide protein
MEPGFDENVTMEVVMRGWPQTIPVILRLGMLCVGCPIAPFHTVADAAREHGLDTAKLLLELQAAAVQAKQAVNS